MVQRLKLSNDTHSNGKPLPSIKKPMGRPSKYQQVFAQQAIKLCKLGATDAELADFFEVDMVTLYRWYCSKPDFRKSVKMPKAEADDRVERSLYQKGVGFWVDTEKLFLLKDDFYDDEGNIVRSTQRVHHEPTREYYPPDTAAAFIWLKNRRKETWRDKHEVDVRGKVENVFTLNIFEHDLSGSMKVIEGEKKSLPRLKNGS